MKKYLTFLFTILLISLFVSCSKDLSKAEKTVSNIITAIEKNDITTVNKLAPFTKQYTAEEFQVYTKIWRKINSGTYKIKAVKGTSDPIMVQIQTTDPYGQQSDTYYFGIEVSEEDYLLQEGFSVEAPIEFIEMIDFRD